MGRSTNPRKLLTADETAQVTAAIQEAECATSAEIKVVIARHCWGDLKTKARRVFHRLGLDQTMALTAEPLSVPRDAVRLVSRCPKCEKPLYAFHYPGTRVAIEACRKCAGLWLDAGEFGEIRKARESLPPQEESAEPAGDVEGVKGALLRFIDSAIDRLMY